MRKPRVPLICMSKDVVSFTKYRIIPLASVYARTLILRIFNRARIFGRATVRLLAGKIPSTFWLRDSEEGVSYSKGLLASFGLSSRICFRVERHSREVAGSILAIQSDLSADCCFCTGKKTKRTKRRKHERILVCNIQRKFNSFVWIKNCVPLSPSTAPINTDLSIYTARKIERDIILF